jgi:hypothetical protein
VYAATQLGSIATTDAQSWLANALPSVVLDNITDSATADLTRAEALAEQAVAATRRQD